MNINDLQTFAELNGHNIVEHTLIKPGTDEVFEFNQEAVLAVWGEHAYITYNGEKVTQIRLKAVAETGKQYLVINVGDDNPYFVYDGQEFDLKVSRIIIEDIVIL